MKPHTFLSAICALLPVLLSQEPSKPDDAAKVWRLRGCVIDEDGNGIAGAGLAMGDPDRVTTASTLTAPQVQTEANGAFELQVMLRKEDAKHVVLLAARGRLSVELDPRFLAWQANSSDRIFDFGAITLPRGVTLRGTVRAAGGVPIRGARVIASDALQELSQAIGAGSTRYTAFAVSDDKGLVELPGVASSGARIEIRADGYHVRVLPLVTPGDPLIAELHPGGFVDGQVTDASGRPCDAFLRVVYEAHEPEREDTLWATGGKFRISLRHAHRYRIHAYYGAGNLGSLSPVLDGPAQGVVVRSVRAGRAGDAAPGLVVRITEAASGKAVEDIRAAAIWEESAGAEDARELEWAFAKSAVEARTPGEIRLAGPKEGEPDKGTVVIRAKGFVPMTLRDVQWSSERPPVLEARLVREAAISGTVVDESGRAIEGAAIIVDEREEDSPWYSGHAGLVSDPDGAFRIGGLAGGKHTLRASAPGLPVADVVEVDVPASSTREGVKLVVPRGASIAGRLVGAEPPSSSQIVLRKRSPEHESYRSHGDSNFTRRAVLGPGGAFAVEGLDRGDYEVELRVPHLQGRGGWLVLPVEPIRVRRNSLQRDFDISEAVPGKLRGKVTLAGATIPHHRLVIAAFANDEDSYRPWAELTVCEPVGADGVFELPVPPGDYRLQLLDLATGIPLHVSTVLPVKAGAVVDAPLKQTLAQVRLRLQPEQTGGAVVASRVEVSVKHDLSGPRRIRIEDHGFPETRAGISLSAGETEMDLVLPVLPVKLRVRSNAGEVLGGESYSDDGPLAELELTPDASKAEQVEIRVPAPRETPAKER
ncbi:MAG: carboxypeptidase-like regulatory domain-containing protein [Planctomycetota bacterium]